MAFSRRKTGRSRSQLATMASSRPRTRSSLRCRKRSGRGADFPGRDKEVKESEMSPWRLEFEAIPRVCHFRSAWQGLKKTRLENLARGNIRKVCRRDGRMIPSISSHQMAYPLFLYHLFPPVLLYEVQTLESGLCVVIIGWAEAEMPVWESFRFFRYHSSVLERTDFKKKGSPPCFWPPDPDSSDNIASVTMDGYWIPPQPR